MFKCQGECSKTGDCHGTVRKVRVVNKEKTVDWGIRYYCQKAIFSDRDKGLLVELQKESIKASDFLKGKF
ncbi:hypothetical protein D3C71_1453520 [compost metagenome]